MGVGTNRIQISTKTKKFKSTCIASTFLRFTDKVSVKYLADARYEMFALRQTWNIAPSSQCEIKFAHIRAANISRELSHFTRRRRISLARKGKFHWKRHLQLIAVPNKATISVSEIARLARGEIIYFVNCENWCCASSEIKFVPSHAADIFHICEANISHRRYFTRSRGTNFTEKWRVKSEEVISKIGKLLLKLADLGN